MGVEYFERQIVWNATTWFVWQDCWGQIDSHDLGPWKDFSKFLGPNTTATSKINDLDGGTADGDTNAGLPEFTHRPMNGVQTIPLSVTVVNMASFKEILIGEKVSIVLVSMISVLNQISQKVTFYHFGDGRSTIDWSRT